MYYILHRHTYASIICPKMHPVDTTWLMLLSTHLSYSKKFLCRFRKALLSKEPVRVITVWNEYYHKHSKSQTLLQNNCWQLEDVGLPPSDPQQLKAFQQPAMSQDSWGNPQALKYLLDQKLLQRNHKSVWEPEAETNFLRAKSSTTDAKPTVSPFLCSYFTCGVVKYLYYSLTTYL